MLSRVILSHVRNWLGSPLLKLCAGVYWPFLEKHMLGFRAGCLSTTIMATTKLMIKNRFIGFPVFTALLFYVRLTILKAVIVMFFCRTNF